MESIFQILFVLTALIVLILFVFRPKRKKGEVIPMPEHYKQLLNENVIFYQRLNDENKNKFEQKMEQFFSEVRITGVNTSVEDLDRVLIGASAIIPIYAFPDFEYIHLREVLLYPGTFSDEFEQEGAHRSVTGMVGSGALQQVMILSKNALRQGFLNNTDKSNTAIHEFVHLIDKTDGAIDGIPEILLEHQYTVPWLNMMRENMQAMSKGESDIDTYGIINPAEFFAVVSEYFFSRPDMLEVNHPELYAMLGRIFLRKEKDER